MSPQRADDEMRRPMDCSTLPDEEHKLLAEYTADARGKGRVVRTKVSYQDAVDLLEAGYLAEIGARTYAVVSPCNCSYLRDAKKARRALSTPLSEQRELHQQSLGEAEIDYDDGTCTVRPSAPSAKGVDRASESEPYVSQSLRSRDGSDSQSEGLLQQLPTNNYRQVAGRRLVGRRLATKVDPNSRLAWKEYPVERWSVGALAGYFDHVSFEKCKGLSLDRVNYGALRKQLSRFKKEGATSVELKQMIDVFIGRVASVNHRVPSLWKSFIVAVPELRTLLTSNATGHYNNQPETAADDEGYL